MENATKLRENSQLNDPIFEQIEEQFLEDIKRSTEIENALNIVIKDKICNEDNLSTKHAFLALGRILIALTRPMCKDQDHFINEVDKAEKLFMDKMLPSTFPAMKDGEVVDKNFDKEDIHIRRILMALGVGVQGTLYQESLATYQARRHEMEKVESLKEA